MYRSNFVQACAGDVVWPPRGYTAFVFGWGLLADAIARDLGFSALHLHDEVIYLRTTAVRS